MMAAAEPATIPHHGLIEDSVPASSTLQTPAETTDVLSIYNTFREENKM